MGTHERIGDGSSEGFRNKGKGRGEKLGVNWGYRENRNKTYSTGSTEAFKCIREIQVFHCIGSNPRQPQVATASSSISASAVKYIRHLRKTKYSGHYHSDVILIHCQCQWQVAFRCRAFKFCIILGVPIEVKATLQVTSKCLNARTTDQRRGSPVINLPLKVYAIRG